MERKNASDFPQELLDLFDGYVHGALSRRQFMDHAQKYAVGGLTAAVLFEMLKPNYAWAQQVAPTDRRLHIEEVDIPSPQGNGHIKGTLARPVGTGKLPVILVVHENRGLNAYIRDVARRLALLGYITLAPDSLTTVDSSDDDERRAALFAKMDREKMQQDFVAAARWLKARPDSTGKLGAIGFCYGGGVVNQLAVRLGPELNAAVPFYGGQPTAAEAAKIKAPINAQYGELDTRITGGWAAYDKALTAAGVPHEGHIYRNANHGFFNDTTPRYDKPGSEEAWRHTQEWFAKYLKA